ncbi:MAG: hypothetical protein HYS56_06145 [Candidatus Omnitrophica bacterium]|nr:hypothetical protein [Candidatus Omnitrophota bacterium]
MPVQVDFLRSFDRSQSALSLEKHEKVKETVIKIIRLAHRDYQASHGLRVKKLTPSIFEARVDIHLRLVFELKHDRLIFILIGNHDDIKRYLRSL